MVDAGADVETETTDDVVGLEFIEEVRNERGVIVSYNCKLCVCSFTDPNAKRVHLKGRRHRLQYKRKIDSSLKVEAKPNSRTQKVREERLKKQLAKESFWRQQDFLLGMRLEQNQSSGDFEMWTKPRKSSGARPTTAEDHYMLTKHLGLYPSSEEMAEIHNTILSFENALKLASDIIATEDTPIEISDTSKPLEVPTPKTDPGKIEAEKTVEPTEISEETSVDHDEPKDDVETEACRVLKGAMRVGPLSKGLLIRGDVVEHLVVICSERPTRSLLQRILDHLPTQLAAVSEKKFDIEPLFEESGLLVKTDEPAASFVVTLTSTPDKEPFESRSDDLLNEECCLSALTQLRRTKWFQVRLSVLRAGTVVAHVIRDLCKRNAAWKPLTEWAQELLVEKCVFAAGLDIGPGEALRTFFECISSGILLPGGHGLIDPCEKAPTDATAELTEQEREQITASAQHFLRMLVCRQIYKILDMEPYRRPALKRRNEGNDERQTGTEPKRTREEDAEKDDVGKCPAKSVCKDSVETV